MTIDTAMVTEQQIFDELKRVLVETFEIDPAAVVPEAKLYDDLDLDSIDAVDLLVKLRPFVGDRNISPNDFKQVRTVGDLVKVLDHILNDSRHYPATGRKARRFPPTTLSRRAADF